MNVHTSVYRKKKQEGGREGRRKGGMKEGRKEKRKGGMERWGGGERERELERK